MKILTNCFNKENAATTEDWMSVIGGIVYHALMGKRISQAGRGYGIDRFPK